MNAQSSELALELIETSPGVTEALDRIDAMSDPELRALVADEHPMVVEAANAIIARRQAADRTAS
jgi:hypothetical protein